MKRPAFQFYPADWRRDAALQSCSVAARGLWIELICVMHDCEPYGVLAVNGKAMSNAQIARLVGEQEKVVARLLAELEDAGVCSRDPEGRVFSRRMVKDEGVREARAAGGYAGAEHGHKGGEHGKKGGRPRKSEAGSKGGEKTPLETPLGFPEEPPPSSSSSSSPSGSSVPDGTDGAAVPAADLSKDELWKAGKSLLAQSGMPAAQCGSFVGKLVKDYGDQIVIDAVRSAVLARPADAPSFLKAACQHAAGARPAAGRKPSSHMGLTGRNYAEGVNVDGTFA